MHKHILLSVFLLCLLLAGGLCSNAYTQTTDPRAEEVDALFARWTHPDTPGAAVAILQDGDVIFKNGYGSATLEYDIPITPATIFHVASVSKQFTAFAVALLADQGHLSLDDDIRTHLPEVPDFGHRITIRHLIHHTSGLRDQWELLAMAGWRLDDVITTDHILKMVRRQQELNFEPGAEYLYCNTGYTLLGEIVARVTGQSFPAWTQANLFEPLGMDNTHFHDDHQMVVKNRAYSYVPHQEGHQKSVLSYANAGATSLFTTVEDLAKWALNFETGHLGGAAVLEQMHERGRLNDGEQISYAFAQSIGTYRGLTTVAHSGGDAGFRSYLVRFPDQRFAVVILSNAGDMAPWRLALDIADLYLADQLAPQEADDDPPADPPTPQPPSLSANALQAYAGTYYSEELATSYTMIVEDGGLVAQHQRHTDIPLNPAEDDVFSASHWWFRKVAFTRDEAAQINGFRLTGGRVRNVRFEKAAPR